MEGFDCGNPRKRKLCRQRCTTCVPRSFEPVQIKKDTIIPSDHWHLELNEGILPHQVSRCCNKKFHFICPECNHTFRTKLDDCSRRGNWCPYCAGKKTCGNINCRPCFERSAQSHLNIHLWSDKNRQEGRKSNPLKILKHTHDMYFFDCDICNHTFEIPLDRLAVGQWCPYCNGDAICPLAKDPNIHNDACEFCWNNTLASQPAARDITKLPGYNPPDFDPALVRKGSNKKIWFTCSRPRCIGRNHHFLASIDNVTINNTWCPHCAEANRRPCNNIHCDTCHEGAFAAMLAYDYLDPTSERNAALDLTRITRSSHKLLDFICIKGHPFTSTPNKITNCNGWCPKCVNKTEAKLFEWLEANFKNLEVTTQKKFDWCRNQTTGRQLPFDFYIPRLKVIIEVDGPQHFVQVHNWGSPEETQKRDQLKEIFATERGLTIVRLLQTDIFQDKNEWDIFLREFLESRYSTSSACVIRKYTSDEEETHWYETS